MLSKVSVDCLESDSEHIIRVYEWDVCDECGERIPDDDAVMHYHAGTVIMLEKKNSNAV